MIQMIFFGVGDQGSIRHKVKYMYIAMSIGQSSSKIYVLW